MKKRILLFLLIIVILIIAVLTWRENRTWKGPIQTVTADEALIQKGRYLAQAADCGACHTAPQGAPYAGGYPLKTPFGTLYGSNLTPSADYGIGRWTAEQFYTAVTTGVAPGGRHLYPGMPYTSYKGLTRDDTDAIYAFLMTRPVVDHPIPKNEMPFPFNQRMAMIGWNLLFHSSSPLPDASEGSTPLWQRGRYLATSLGHCAECHTPRGMLGQMQQDKMLQGSLLGRASAPDITPKGLIQRGWTPEDLQQFLTTGIAQQGSAFGEMYTVVNLSLQHLNTFDQKALVAYLMGDTPPAKPSVSPKPTITEPAGRTTWLDVCAGCHAVDGQGKPNVAVNMNHNATVRQADATNLIVSILDGIPQQDFPNGQSMQAMPGFAGTLSDKEIAGLVNYLRQTWGQLPPSVTPEQVKALHEHVEK